MIAFALGRVLSLIFLTWQSAVEGDAGFGPATREELQSMRIAQLRSFLKARGEECRGCIEKADFVERAFAVRERTPPADAGESDAEQLHQQQDHQSAEDIPVEPDSEEELARKAAKRAQLEDFLRKMKMQGGFGDAKVFTADDLRGMSPDEMERKFGGKSKPAPEGSGKDKTRSRRSSGGSGRKSSSGGGASSGPTGGQHRRATSPRVGGEEAEDVLEL